MLIATKLFMPPIPAGLVNRPRLFSALDQAWNSGQQLFLLSAPPGYGKTTLISEWIAARSISTVWLALDADDNDPARFAQYLLFGLKKFLPGLEELLSALNISQNQNLEYLITEAINHIVQSKETILLVLDDYHALDNPRVHALTQYLLDHQPPQIRLAIVTRSDPPLNLPRLRARRRMLEIRQSDFSFTQEEAGNLLQNALGESLTQNQVHELTERTEGWAVGLHLAAFSLREQPDPAQFIDEFSGSHRYVLDYLVSEVLSNLPDALRSFLCQSAVLERFCPELLDEVLKIDDSREILTRVENANLFLIPLDSSRNWYRYHHLMAEILRAELETIQIRRIQRGAALWLSANDHPLEAVNYAFKAEDLELAGALIRQTAVSAAENGMLTVVLSWLDRLPEAMLLADPELAVMRAWFLIYNARFHDVMVWLQKLNDPANGLMNQLARPEKRPIAGLLMGLQAWLHTTQGQKMDLRRLEQSLEMMADQYTYFTPLIFLALGQAQREAGLINEAQRSFEEGMARSEATGGAVTALILGNNLAFLLNSLGRRSAAIELCKEGIRCHSPNNSPGLLAGIPLLALGCLLYQSGKLDEAYNALTQSLNLVRRLGLYDVLASPANQVLQTLLVDQGRTQDALALNQETRRQAQKAGLPAVADFMQMMEAAIQLHSGSEQTALRWTKANPFREDNPGDLANITVTLLHIHMIAALGNDTTALSALKPLESSTLASGRVLDWIQVKLEQSLIHQARGRESEALNALDAALKTASEIEYRQVFRRESARLADPLEKLRSKYPGFIASILGEESAPAKKDHALIDPPTERELEILRLVAAGLSNAEIAERLFITVGTTKWHLNHLFAKLGVRRRTEALVQAREYGLI